MARSGAFAPPLRAPAGSARDGSGRAVGGMPLAGAVMVGTALSLGLALVAAVVLGTLQRFALAVAVPGWAYALGAYLCVATGGWTAGRLTRRAGLISGALVGVLLVALAAWLAGRASDVPPGVTLAINWPAALWRMGLAVAAAALAGGLAVSGS